MSLIHKAFEEFRTAARQAADAFRVPSSDGRRRWRPPTRRESALLSLLLVPFAFAGWERCGVGGCPGVDRLVAYQPGGAPVVLDRDGEVVATLAPVRREVIAFDSLPEHVGEAFVAVEDQRFYGHGGIDVRRVAGAALADIRAGGFVQGSSTITMQLARNVFPDRLPANKSMRRKLMEVRVAREIEDRFSKAEILELYLNHIYFGNGVYGIAAASRYYFGRPASQLTLAQAASLAAMPRSPAFYDPRRNPDAARSRRNLILAMMAEQGRVTEDEAESAAATRLGVTGTPQRRPAEEVVAPYFIEVVRRVAEDALGDALYSSALRIHTTLDRRAQRVAEEELARHLGAIEAGRYGRFEGPRYRSAMEEPPDYLQGAVVVMDPVAGDVIALVGGRDYRHSAFDRATRARRQVGSAFKPFVFATALADGYAASQHVADSPLRMELAGGEVWEPRNFIGGFEGEVTLRDALVRSKNVPAVRLASAVGLRDVARTAQRAGVHSAIPELPSMALGTAALSPLEITAAYSIFANGGRATAPRFIERIEDPDGHVVWNPRQRQPRVLDEGVAYLVTDMLAEAVDRGTATAVRHSGGYRGAAAGKTGTTDNGTDTWFVGFTPELVAGVWIGFDTPAPIVGDASGGRLAAPLWGRTMQRIYRDREGPGEWTEPDRIVRHRIDPATGLVLAEGCTTADGGDGIEELFVKGNVPARACPAGEQREGRGVIARAFAYMRHVWYRAGEWTLARFRDDADSAPDERERMLGTRRLPRSAEIRAPAIDTAEYPRLLGVPWVPDTAADTLRVDVPRADTIVIDTLSIDTLAIDTMVIDTIRGDTIRRDTIRIDTIRSDTTARDSIAAGTGASPVRISSEGRRLPGEPVADHLVN
jgi:1A family penicillin-binding protein